MAGDAGAPAGGVATQGDAATAGGQTAEQQGPQFDPQQVTSTLAELRQGQSDLGELVRQLVPEPQEAEPEVLPELDLSQFTLDPYADEQTQQAQQQQLAALINERIQAGVDSSLQQHLNPLRDQVQEMRDGLEIQALHEEFPIFGQDPQAAEEMVQTAHTIAQSRGWNPEVANDPHLWRLVTMASLYAKGVAEDGSSNTDDAGSVPGAQLESAGGAGPLGYGPDPAAAIVNAGGRRGARALPL
jgi:hypothetical protein